MERSETRIRGVRMTDELWGRATAAAEADGMTASAFIRVAMIRRLAERDREEEERAGGRERR